MLSLQIYTDPDQGTLLADYTSRLHPPHGRGLSFSTNQHGFAALEVPIIPMSLTEAFTVYDWPGTPHVVASDSAAGVVWEGRLEDIAIIDGGVRLAALGYQRALRDVPYTALWSKTGSGGWRPSTEDDLASNRPDRYEMDNNNRIYIAPRKGETYATGTQAGAQTFAAPHLGQRDITNFACDYSMLLPNNWRFEVYSLTDAFGSATALNTVTANGSSQSGSLALTLGTPRPRLLVRIFNNTGSDSTISSDTGVNFLKLTNIRIKTTTSTTVLASEIAAALATFINGVNSNQLSDSDALIEATDTDLQDELYEDLYPAEILQRLGELHTYEWGVWEGQQLHFRSIGSRGRDWYVDVTRIVELERSLENIRNSAYAKYKEASGRVLRTANLGDSSSQSRYGLVRRGFVNTQTTSLTQAQAHRGVFLEEKKNLTIRAKVEFGRLYDATGAGYPLYELRAGDTVTMRNLAPTLSTTVDRIRSFVVGETSYNALTNEMNVSPADPVPTLVTMVAKPISDADRARLEEIRNQG